MALNKVNDGQMILLEGNIGAGKTTVGKAIAASGEFGFIEEPTRAWRENYATNMLDNLYKDIERWAFTFQICTFVTRAKTWHEISALTDKRRVVLERSIYCDRFVFVENFYRSGVISLTEYQLYRGLWEFMISNYSDQPDLIIYLRTPAEVCLQRIKDRGRAEESGITLEYLLRLEQLHDEWLRDGSEQRSLVLDGERWWNTNDILAEVDKALR